MWFRALNFKVRPPLEESLPQRNLHPINSLVPGPTLAMGYQHTTAPRLFFFLHQLSLMSDPSLHTIGLIIASVGGPNSPLFQVESDIFGYSSFKIPPFPSISCRNFVDPKGVGNWPFRWRQVAQLCQSCPVQDKGNQCQLVTGKGCLWQVFCFISNVFCCSKGFRRFLMGWLWLFLDAFSFQLMNHHFGHFRGSNHPAICGKGLLMFGIAVELQCFVPVSSALTNKTAVAQHIYHWSIWSMPTLYITIVLYGSGAIMLGRSSFVISTHASSQSVGTQVVPGRGLSWLMCSILITPKASAIRNSDAIPILWHCFDWQHLNIRPSGSQTTSNLSKPTLIDNHPTPWIFSPISTSLGNRVESNFNKKWKFFTLKQYETVVITSHVFQTHVSYSFS